MIRRVCEALGVSYQGQIEKLKSDPSIWLRIILRQIDGADQRREIDPSVGVEMISTPSADGFQSFCVQIIWTQVPGDHRRLKGDDQNYGGAVSEPGGYSNSAQSGSNRGVSRKVPAIRGARILSGQSPTKRPGSR